MSFCPPSTTKMSLNSLPDVCLLWLFQRKFSFKELLALRAICRKWNTLVFEALRSGKSRATFLMLYESKQHFWRYLGSAFGAVPWNMQPKVTLLSRSDHTEREDRNVCLSLPRRFFDRNSDIYLPNLLPKLNKLLLHKNELVYRLDILRGFPHLTELYLMSIPKGVSQKNKFWTSIESMHSLVSLYMIFEHKSANSDKFPPKFETLSRLEKFTLANYNPADIGRVLGQLGSPIRELSIWYDNRVYPTEETRTALVSNPLLGANLTHFKWWACQPLEHGTGAENLSIIKTLVEHFPKLEFLEIPCYELTLATLVPYLSRMTNLNTIVLDMIADKRFWSTTNEPLKAKLPNIKRLIVKDMHVTLSCVRFVGSIPNVFTNLEVFHYHATNSVCRFEKYLKRIKTLEAIRLGNCFMMQYAGKYADGMFFYLSMMCENYGQMA